MYSSISAPENCRKLCMFYSLMTIDKAGKSCISPILQSLKYWGTNPDQTTSQLSKLPKNTVFIKTILSRNWGRSRQRRTAGRRPAGTFLCGSCSPPSKCRLSVSFSGCSAPSRVDAAAQSPAVPSRPRSKHSCEPTQTAGAIWLPLLRIGSE